MSYPIRRIIIKYIYIYIHTNIYMGAKLVQHVVKILGEVLGYIWRKKMKIQGMKIKTDAQKWNK